MAQVRGFFEYLILPERRDAFLQLIKQVRMLQTGAGFREYSLCESLVQQNLFVETFLLDSLEEYQAIKAKLLDDPATHALYNQLHEYIAGGPAKKKEWFFEEVPLG
jgi:Transmembrane secretion effector